MFTMARISSTVTEWSPLQSPTHGGSVLVGLGVGVAVLVAVGVHVWVGVSVGVSAGVLVGVCVGTAVGVLVGTGVSVGVGGESRQAPSTRNSPVAQLAQSVDVGPAHVTQLT